MTNSYLFGLRGRALEHGLLLAIIFPGYVLLGWNNGILGSLIDGPNWVATFPSINTLDPPADKVRANAQLQGTVVALYPLGALFGSLLCILIADPLGRKRTMTLGLVVHIIGVIIESSSFSLAQLIVGRLITGFGFGTFSATCPNWQSECSGAGHRGAAVIFESVFISLGFTLQGWITFGMGFTTGSVVWRYPLAMSIFWALLVILGLTFVPESPRWLVKCGRVVEAREVLSALQDDDPDSPEVSDAVAEIEQSLKVAGEGSLKDVFTNGDQRFFNRFVISCAAGAFQQLNGINALAFYLTTIFEQYLGLTGKLPSILSACTFTWQLLFSPIGVLTVDRLGRRKLMIVSAIGMGVCMAMISGLGSQTQNKAAEAAAAAFVFLFSCFFPVGFLGMTFLYSSEIAPLSVRTHITSFSTASVWLSNFVTVEATPAGLATISYRYFIVWASINLFLITPTVYFFFPETSGRTLEEIDQIFEGSKNFLDPVKVSRQMRTQGISMRRKSEIEEVTKEKL